MLFALGTHPASAAPYANGADLCGSSPDEYIEVATGAPRTTARGRRAVRDVPVVLYQKGRPAKTLGRFALAVVDRAGDARATIRAVTGMGEADMRFVALLKALSGSYRSEPHAVVILRDPGRGIISAGVIDLTAAKRYALICAGSTARHRVRYDVQSERARDGFYRIPLRFLGEVLGATVLYKPRRIAIVFHTPPSPTATPATVPPSVSPSPCPNLSVDQPNVSTEVGRSFVLRAQRDGKPATDPLKWGPDDKKLVTKTMTGSDITLQAIASTGTGVTTVRVWVVGFEQGCTPGKSDVVIASPTPSPVPSHSPQPTAGSELAVVPIAVAAVYNEFSPGNQAKYDPAYHAAYAFPRSSPRFRVSLDYTQYRYLHNAGAPLGGSGLCPSSDSSCVTLIGHKRIEPQLGVGQYYIGSFTAIDRDVDARAEVRVAGDWFVVGGYTVRNFAHLGYPLLTGAGYGIEKLERPSRKIDVRGSLLYYPNVAGEYRYSCIPTLFAGCGSLSGTSTTLSYRVLKYDLGVTIEQGTAKSFVLLRAIGDYGFDRTNAPGGFNHSRFEVGYGVRP